MAQASPSPPGEAGTGEVQARRCSHCGKPLRASARSDARFDRPPCKAAHRRARRHHADAVKIGFAIIDGRKTDVSKRCPVCGKRFVPGHGHRRDAVVDRPCCRVAAWRSRQRVREAVHPPTQVPPLAPVSAR